MGAACVARPALVPPDDLLLGGSVTLSVDETAGRARLRVRTIRPSKGTPPAERHGLALDECATLLPLVPLEGEVLMDAEVQAWCGGQPLGLNTDFPGHAEHLFARPPPPGTVCEVSVNGERITLPALPVAPVVDVVRGRLSWLPADADELRYVIPRTHGESTICRLRDDGDAPAPIGARLHLSFASRVALALPPLGTDARLPVSVIAGTWRRPPD